MNANLEVKLAPPGAGLPAPELQIARLLFLWRKCIGNREIYNTRFQQERRKIRALLTACEGATGGQRVLIRRVRGLEDSSRNWSVWMTLDHLRIVHRSIALVIGALSRGKAMEGQASTAAVKPSPEVTSAIIAEYEQSCDDLLATVEKVKDWNSPARYAHPWFGPLDARGWHALSAGHLRIHRVQIERIIEGLGRAGG